MMKLKKVIAAVLSLGITGSFMPVCLSSAADQLIPGDINLDGRVNVSDLNYIKSIVIGENSTTKTADVNQDGAVNASDCVILSRYFLGLEKSLPEIKQQQTPSVSPSDLMADLRNTLTTPEPASVSVQRADVDYGTVKEITYFSTTANRNKNASVILPAGYNENQKYPVLYVNHGIFGNHMTMFDQTMAIQTIAANLAADGEAVQMIIVYTSMFSSSTMTEASGFDLESTKGYDAFLDDLTKDLMPYMEKNFSIKTGRENTAITGFSMGGREALYIGVSRPDLFGYIGAACPAPGVTPAQDMFMVHPGNMQESEFKIDAGENSPYIFLITGATNDGMVGEHPKLYHEILTKNGCDHVWQEVPQGGHDGITVKAHFYNFARYLFKATK